MSLSKPLTLRHLCHLLNNMLGLSYHRHIVFLTISLVKNTKCYVPKKNWELVLTLSVKIGMLCIHDCIVRPCLTVQFFLQLVTLFYSWYRCKIGKYTFPSQFANIFSTYQTFVTNLHRLRVELHCKLPCRNLNCTVWQLGSLAHDVVLNHTFELRINTTMLFWYISNEHFNK